MGGNQRILSVGILSAPTIEFEIAGVRHQASFHDGRIEYQGGLHNELLFQGPFTLSRVKIGIGFHWEREELQSFDGDLKIIVEDDKLTAVNIVGVEDYLLSVISSEMSATASKEFLKAHAVVSRSWLLAQIAMKNHVAVQGVDNECETVRWYDRDDHKNFDVCADDHCQRYQGMTKATTDIVREVINETWGEVLVCDGEICDARFSKCCGGAFEEFETCWQEEHHKYLLKGADTDSGILAGDLSVEENARKWILSKPESFCNTSDKQILSQVLNNYDQETSDFYRWKVIYSAEELSELIKRKSGVDYGEIVDLIPIERGASGRICRLKIIGTKCTRIIGKELEIRKTLSESHLYSSAFVVEKIDDRFIINGAGWGHGVGMCQIGAAVMGSQGYDYKSILNHYYKNIEIKNNYGEEN